MTKIIKTEKRNEIHMNCRSWRITVVCHSANKILVYHTEEDYNLFDFLKILSVYFPFCRRVFYHFIKGYPRKTDTKIFFRYYPGLEIWIMFTHSTDFVISLK